ncbi:MAG: alcohol dehydrogenase catalytic domain-containing protein [Vicinamibacterales bacterium]|nr:alcohol dehydrogenase catalytic domain-containing protein [Vicinamibacterales bacterium]
MKNRDHHTIAAGDDSLLMQMMSAAVLAAAPGALRIERIPVPEPRAGEILVKVSACGVCHTDLHIMKAEVAFPLPAVLGHEISGVVASLGPGVSGPVPGTRVVSAFIMPCGQCSPCGAGRDDLCDKFFAMNRLRGTLYDGSSRLRRTDGTAIAMYSMAGLAEFAVVPATDVFPLPAELPLEESAVLGCAVFTAYGAVRHAADLRGASFKSPARSGRRRLLRSMCERIGWKRRACSARQIPSTARPQMCRHGCAN